MSLPRQPALLFLRSLVLGYVFAALWWSRHGVAGTSLGSVFGQSLSEDDLMMRSWRTLFLVLAVLLLSITLGLGIATVAARWGRRFPRVLAWLGTAMACVPVVGLGWLVVAWLVNHLKLPIESLIPYTPPPERDASGLQLGRWLWAWMVPLWVLVLPLAGEWCALCLRHLSAMWPLEDELELRAAGKSDETFLIGHWLRKVWRLALQREFLGIAFTALGFTVVVEDLFGLPGWGSFLAQGIRLGHHGEVAAALVMGALLSASLAVLAHLLVVDRNVPKADALAPQIYSPSSRHAGIASAFFLVVEVLVLVLCLEPEPPPWINDWLLPWVDGMLPRQWQGPIHDLMKPTLGSLHEAGVATAWAALTVVVLGSLACLGKQVRAMPRFDVLDTVAWSPLLVWALAMGSPRWIGILIGIAGASRWRDLALALNGADYSRAAKMLGVPLWQRWMRHFSPPMMAAFTAWSFRCLGQALLWVVLSDALREGTTLGGRMAQSRDTVLANPADALWPTAVAALAILFFHVLARLAGGDVSRLKFPNPRLR